MSKKSELRRSKYAYLMNFFQDDKIARAGRDWSWSTIRRKVALDKPEDIKSIKLKNYADSTKRKKKSLLSKTNYMVELGFTPDFVARNRKLPKNEFENYIEVNTGELFNKKVASPVDDNERLNTWKYWSIKQEHNFPKGIMDEIHKLNLGTKHDTAEKVNLDINSKYGFALAYFMYFNEIELEEAKKIIEPDFMGGGYLYLPERRIN